MELGGPTKLKAYSYIRWSSERQTTGDSFERQIRKTRDICRQRGWDLDESMKVDEGVSAYRGDNLLKGSLGKFIESVDSGRIVTPCILVVEAFDRLTRARLRESRRLFESLLEKGVQICTANNGKLYDESCLDSPADLIISLTELNAGHEYARVIGERSRSAWERKKRDARNGKLVTRKLPAWVRCPSGATKTSELQVVEEKADVVRRIFRQYLAGIGSRTIALQMTREGVKPFGKAKLWNVSSVFRILKSKATIGEYQPQSHLNRLERADDGPSITDYYPAILDKGTFYQAQEMLRKQLVPRGPRQNCYNLFTGVAECSKCGSKMVLKTGAVSKNKKTPHITLVCSKAWRGGDCDYATIKYQMVEDAILSLLSSKVVTGISSEKSGYAKKISLQGELEAIGEQLTNLTQACLKRGTEKVPELIFAKMNQLEKRQHHLIGELESFSNRPKESLVSIISKWQPLASTADERRRIQPLLRSVISKLKIDASKLTASLHLSASDKPFNLRWNENRPDEVHVGNRRLICFGFVFDDNEERINPMTCTLIRGDRVKFLGLTESDFVGRHPKPVIINGEPLKCIKIRTKSSTIFREHLPETAKTSRKRPRYFRLREIDTSQVFYCPNPKEWRRVEHSPIS